MTKNFRDFRDEMHGYKYEYPYIPDKINSHEIVTFYINSILYKQRVVKHIF